MAFGLDDIAVIASEVAEADEAVEGVTEEVASSEFNVSNFESNQLEDKPTSQFENVEGNSELKETTQGIEQEFSPENFSDSINELNRENPDSEDITEGDEQSMQEIETFEAEDSEEIIQIKTINSGLEEQHHPVTGVKFERKVVTNEVGEKVEGVFPQFESVFDAQLPENLQLSSDAEQFNECNRQLKEKFEADPSFRELFDERQRDNIENGETPYGYSWHHSEDVGKMQLVDYDNHQKTAHTGGRNIWGGGSDFR